MSARRERAFSPLVGLVCLVAVTVAASAAVGAAALSVAPPDPAPTAALSVTATDDGRVTLLHRGGAPLAVGDLRLELSVDGEPLTYQPPVPFVGAAGYRGAPGGPFNAAAEGTWTAGERATLRVAGTNDPALRAGARLTVEVWSGGIRAARVSTTVQD
ncbi:type IV pilin [Halosegnis marinus]|uniref:Type IV pilin n=1 Tax=Halosegnis marinus TaxID=3034023 RepID=A0ABD5ZP79_9EURY|nr:type IV pilin [Halosegnis sp. DT85]